MALRCSNIRFCLESCWWPSLAPSHLSAGGSTAGGQRSMAPFRRTSKSWRGSSEADERAESAIQWQVLVERRSQIPGCAAGSRTHGGGGRGCRQRHSEDLAQMGEQRPSTSGPPWAIGLRRQVQRKHSLAVLRRRLGHRKPSCSKRYRSNRDPTSWKRAPDAGIGPAQEANYGKIGTAEKNQSVADKVAEIANAIPLPRASPH
jgi:hypothetical protein